MAHRHNNVSPSVHFPMFVIHNTRVPGYSCRHLGWLFNTFPQSATANPSKRLPPFQSLPNFSTLSCTVSTAVQAVRYPSLTCAFAQTPSDTSVSFCDPSEFSSTRMDGGLFHLNWWWCSFAYNSEGNSFCMPSKTWILFLDPFYFSHSFTLPPFVCSSASWAFIFIH